MVLSDDEKRRHYDAVRAQNFIKKSSLNKSNNAIKKYENRTQRVKYKSNSTMDTISKGVKLVGKLEKGLWVNFRSIEFKSYHEG